MLNHFLYRSPTRSLLFHRTFSSTLVVKGIVTELMLDNLEKVASGISFSSTEETLTEAFSQCGRVLGVDVVMDKVRRRPKGFAYITFSSREEADKALLELNGQLVDGRVLILDTTKAVKQNPPDSQPKHAVEGVPSSQNKVIPES